MTSQTPDTSELINMDIIAANGDPPQNDVARDHLPSTAEDGFPKDENLNVETVTSNPLLRKDQRWAIRFRADGTIAILLGMRDYGRGLFSAYFAALAAARLGVPFQRVRICYTGNLPAVLQSPRPSAIVADRDQIGPIARAAAEVIEGMCDRAIEKARSAFAVITGVTSAEVGFDQSIGRYFVIDPIRSSTILEMADNTRGESSASIAFWKELHRRCNGRKRGVPVRRRNVLY
jgi:hypothetical protein